MRAATESSDRFSNHSFARAFRPLNVERFFEGKRCIRILRSDRPAESRPEYFRGVGASAVAVVIHATSDQALREPKQTNETGGDDQQSQDSVCGADVETLLCLPPHHHWEVGLRGTL